MSGENVSVSMTMGNTTMGDHSSQYSKSMITHALRSRFTTAAGDRTYINGENASHILAKLNIVHEVATLRKLLRDWDKVEYDEFEKVALQLQDTAVGDEDCVELPPREYLKYVLPCFRKNPELDGKKVTMSTHIEPRQLLFISTGLVLLFTGLCITLLMAMLWLAQANDRERTQIRNFHVLVHSFCEAFEQKMTVTHADGMVDLAFTLATILEHQKGTRQDTIIAVMKDTIETLADVLRARNTNIGQSFTMGMQEQYAELYTLSQATTLPLPLITALVGTLKEDPDWDTFAVDMADPNAPRTLLPSKTPECAHGDCDYAGNACVAAALNSSGVQHFPTLLDVHRNPAVMFSLRPANTSIVVCSSRPLAASNSQAQALLASFMVEMNAVMGGDYYSRYEFIMGTVVESVALDGTVTRSVRYDSAYRRNVDSCYADGECMGLDNQMIQTFVSKQPHGGIVLGYNGENIISASTILEGNRVVSFNIREEAFLEALRQNIIDHANWLNFNTVRSTEVAIGRIDKASGVLITQVNPFRFTDGCYQKCERRPPSTTNAQAAFETRGSGWSITPDYRPEPVLGAYAFLGAGLDLSILFERDVIEIRGLSLSALVNIFDNTNKLFSGSLEGQLMRIEGVQASKLFSPNASCYHVRDCETLPQFGTFYRSDCVHCIREVPVDQHNIEFLTQRKKTMCTTQPCPTDRGISFEAANSRYTGLTTVTGDDYAGQPVLGVYSFLENYSTTLIMKFDKEEIEGPITERIVASVGVALAIVLFGLLLLIFFSRQVLDKIEYEWLSYKRQIDEERSKFDDMVSDAVPPFILDDIARGKKMGQAIPSLCFVFLDICGMSDKGKSWSPDLVCRYITYTVTVMEQMCNHYNILKLRVFGDTFFAVGGLNDDQTTGPQHCVIRVSSFASAIIQVFSQKYAHYPDSVPHIRHTFADFVNKNGPMFPDVTGPPEAVGHIVMPSVRIGMHYGVGASCVLETGRTPSYEIFGPGVALAARMQATSRAHRIHMSGATKETLERNDTERAFEFDAARKTVVKGQGTVTSYFLNSANVSVPTPVMETLGIQYSNLRIFYDDQQKGTEDSK